MGVSSSGTTASSATPARRFARRTFIGMAAVSAAAVAAACGSSGTADPGGLPPLTERQQQIFEVKAQAAAQPFMPAKQAVPNRPLTVYFAQSLFGPAEGNYGGIVQLAADLEPGTPKLTLKSFPRPGEALTIGRTLALLADTLPVDLLLFPAALLPDLNANELLLPLDKISHLGPLLKAENYWPEMLASGQLKGRQLALPLVLGLWLLLFNRRRLDDFGVAHPTESPWDLKRFEENVSRLTRAGGEKAQAERFGFLQVLPELLDLNPIPPSWVWMISAGTEMPGRDGGEAALTGEPALAALKLLNRLVNDYRSVYRAGSGFSARTVRGLIDDERVAMLSIPVNAGWFVPGWRKPDQTKGFDLGPLPGGKRHFTPAEVHVMAAVSAQSSEPDAAITALGQLYKSTGQKAFPSAIRADAPLMRKAESTLREIDVAAIIAALTNPRPIVFSPPEMALLADKLDRAVGLQKTPIDQAVASAVQGLRQARGQGA